MTTTWHRLTRRDWYATGIDSHDEADCPGPNCPGEVVPPGDTRSDMRDHWMEREQIRKTLTPESRAESLSNLVADVERIQRQIAGEVDDARAASVPWSTIGMALGMSRQAAQQRYGG